ncbi:hypothetical protein J4H86_25460 [Spiractinospora alimapuensis]|uniref:hypothetical protein n=1 Tax=Spiractinospora alimapuensis TaxID=2820884 RepID=UPI001F30BAE4|nr:hypothetical protein [Spiractinospora alimapuensis]QVQ52037.1 hypothetical protein J4H86_25460 [Spiractinospora alimapuensis]
MRWVTYLSPSGGGRRPGVVDDGDVFGYPGGESLAELLGAGDGAVTRARDRALGEPVEIIVELEARLCAPLRPERAVTVVTPNGSLSVDPANVGGPDDGVPVPVSSAVVATAGVVDFFADGRHAGRSLACLWTTADATGLTIGGVVTTGPDIPTVGEVTVEVETQEASAALPPVPEAVDGVAAVARMVVGPRSVELGEELFVGGEDLGAFEIRVGALA